MVFKCYGLPYIKSVIANNEHEAVGAARAMGFPLALKILSPDILHKTEARGVVLNISSEDGVRAAFDAIMHNARTYKPDARIHGVLIQKMARPGATEVIMGASKDPQFGPVVMFGLGGIFVEVLKDVSFRAAPVSPSEALEMIKEIKSYEIIKGYRGKKPKDIEYLAETISRLSQLITDFPEIKEIDANPAMLYEDDLDIVDALITLEE
jgi:acyl-CoA synthetase (NDP forming)